MSIPATMAKTVMCVYVCVYVCVCVCVRAHKGCYMYNF